MNKKLIAVAIAGAVAAPAAMAQGSNPVTLYGLMHVSFGSVEAKGATVGASNLSRRYRVTDAGASRLGVRGTEDIGGGTKAFFQIESGLSPDEGAARGVLASRNTGVGLQGGWGSLVLGRWDTPYKLASIGVDPWGDINLGGYNSVIHGHANAGGQGNFDRRENNAVQYWTPNMSGFQARVHYGANEGKTSSINPYTLSFSLGYGKGPLTVFYSGERHKDSLGGTATAGSRETGNEFGGTFSFGKVKLGAMYETIKRTGPAVSQKNKAYYVSADVGLAGGHGLRAALGRNKLDGNSSFNTSAFALGYYINLTKRTSVDLNIAQVKNNSSATNGFGGSFDRAGLTVGAGADPRGFTVGVKHTF